MAHYICMYVRLNDVYIKVCIKVERKKKNECSPVTQVYWLFSYPEEISRLFLVRLS